MDRTMRRKDEVNKSAGGGPEAAKRKPRHAGLAWVMNLQVGARMGAGYLLVLALMIVSTVVGVVRLAGLSEVTETIVDRRYPQIELSNAMVLNLNIIGASFRNMLLESDEDAIKREMERAQRSGREIEDALKELTGAVNDDKARELLAAVAETRRQAVADEARFMALMRDGKWEDATNLLLGSVRKTQAACLESLVAFVNFNRGRMALARGEAQDSYEAGRNVMIALAVAATLVGCLVAWIVTRTITVPLREAVDVARKVAEGDLTAEVTVRSRDETGQLLAALKNMNEALGTIVREVRTSTDAVTSASEQIAVGNADLSSRTEQQAASLEEAAASMERLYCAVRQNAENAGQANQLASGASEVAVKGGEVVGEVVHTMAAINDSSKKIEDIIAVIDGIAFQTNILALNAAVEAARAGEQGRGFAVVASEVRSLAQRSAAAAKEIKTLITDSVTKVQAGSRLVEEAGRTMDDIVASVKRVTDIMGEIAAATQEQTHGIEQVNQAVGSMDETTQQNAALVEEAAAAAESLKEQAVSLTRAVSVFRVSARLQSGEPPEESGGPDSGLRGTNRQSRPLRRAA